MYQKLTFHKSDFTFPRIDLPKCIISNFSPFKEKFSASPVENLSHNSLSTSFDVSTYPRSSLFSSACSLRRMSHIKAIFHLNNVMLLLPSVRPFIISRYQHSDVFSPHGSKIAKWLFVIPLQCCTYFSCWRKNCITISITLPYYISLCLSGGEKGHLAVAIGLAWMKNTRTIRHLD